MLLNADFLRIPRRPATLLLAGGVFGFGVILSWLLATYRLVMAPVLPPLPPETSAALYLDGPWPIELARLLPENLGDPDGALLVLGGTGAERGAALMRNLPKRPVFIPKPYSGIGFASLNGRGVPLLAHFDGSVLRLRFGRSFRGIDLDGRGLPRRPALAVMPSSTAAYYSDPGPAASFAALEKAGLPSAQALHGWGLSGILGALPGPTETAILGPGPFAPFIIHSAPAGGADMDRRPLDAAVRAAVGRAAPLREKMALPDESQATEMRSSAESVRVEESDAHGILTKKFVSPDGAVTLIYALGDDGRLWLGNDAQRMQEALFMNLSSTNVDGYSCSGVVDRPQVLIYSQKLGKNALFAAFKAVAVTIDDTETGLFTFCGYLQ